MGDRWHNYKYIATNSLLRMHYARTTATPDMIFFCADNRDHCCIWYCADHRVVFVYVCRL